MEFLQTLAPLIELGVGPVFIVAGVFTRISTMALFLPGIGERAVNVRVRLGAAMAITFIVMPLIMSKTPPAPETASALTLLLLAEAISGALIGFTIRVAVFALQTAGSIVAQHISLSQLFGGFDGTPEPPVAVLFMIAGIALAVNAGIHFKAVEALAITYETMPFGAFPGSAEAGSWAAERAAFAFSAAFSLSLPFIVLGFIYNLAIGAANRAMPQLMVAFVGAPAITLAGLSLLALTTPFLLGVWLQMTEGVFATLLEAAR